MKAPQSTDTSGSSQDDSNIQLQAHFAKAAEDLENAMKSVLGDEPELLAQLGQFAQAAAKAEHGKVLNVIYVKEGVYKTGL